MLVIVILTIRLNLPGVGSLKEKRRIIKSLLARLRNNFNITIAEIDENDALRKTTLGAAIVSNSTSFGDKVISKVVNKIEASPDVMIVEYNTERY